VKLSTPWLLSGHRSQNVGQPTTPTQNATTQISINKPHSVEDWLEQEYGHPISFYGKVVDENEIPIAGASVEFERANAKGEGLRVSSVSDSIGLFSVTGIKGKNLGVNVSKDGYYGRQDRFEYADPGRGLFKPDPSHPVIFHLRKKGPGAKLITSKSALRPDLGIKAPTNGTPIFIDLYNRKAGAVGELQIESWKEQKDFSTGQNNWGLRLTIPGGGLFEESDEFPFEAPETGYQSVIEWHFNSGQNDWREVLKKSFDIKFGNPPRYGKITVETGSFSQAIFLEYAFNPDGSRYLEPK
jgi:hypothetical protein